MEIPQKKYLKDYTPPAYWIDKIDLTFDLTEQHAIVTAVQKIRRNKEVAEKKSPLVLDGKEMELVSLELNGKPLTENEYQIESENLSIFNVPEDFSIKVITKIKPQENTSLEGLYRSSGMFCTQCEAEGFRKITYYPDRPDVMAKFTCRIIADKDKYPVLLSNGNPVEKGDLDDNRHFAEWHDPFKKPSYLFALVAGDLVCIEDSYQTLSGRDVAIKIYVESMNADKCNHAIRSLKKAMKWDEDKFGREYDLDIYMIVAVNDFNMGAMENKGLNVFNSKYVLAKPETATDTDYVNIEGVVAHEYFHNWTGNRITCKNWFQLSLKEGLTVFRDQEFSADMASRAVKRISDVRKLRSFQFPEDDGPNAHPVRPDSYAQMNNFYTHTVYDKGAEVIRMIYTILGPENFRKGMDLYFERHDGQAVTTEDFVAAMEDANSVDLEQFRLWYSQAGTPKVSVEKFYNEKTGDYSLTLTQACPKTPGQEIKEPMHIPVAVGLLDASGKDIPDGADNDARAQTSTRIINLSEKKQTYTFQNISGEPVPSLFRGFSAPVKLMNAYSDEELVFLLANDSDPFNRWDAGQQLFTKVMLRLVKDIRKNRNLVLDSLLVDAFQSTLKSKTLDKALIAQTLSLPTESELGEKMADAEMPVDPDAIHNVREFVTKSISGRLYNDFLDTYSENTEKKPYAIDSFSMAKRSLKNLSLFYISKSGTGESTETVYKQFQEASNMTDELTAFSFLVNMESRESSRAIDHFYEKWQNDKLVLDKWFMVQATSLLPGTLLKVKELMEHSDFSIRNPNKVRSVIGAFCSGNPWNFHHASGSGYIFLADQIIILDKMNPQIAARLAGIFNPWKKYDQNRQTLMKDQLERILSVSGLSADVSEIVSNALGIQK